MTSNSCASAALKIVVTGATGFIGGRLIASTKLRECELLPVIRSKEKAALLGIDKWILFQELTQKSIVDAGFESSVIVHLIGSSRDEEGCSLRESIVATTEAVVTVARETRSKRVLYLSGYGITPDSSDAYFKSKAEAEKIIQDSGIPYTLFRPSYILGPGDELTPYLVQELEKGSIEIPGDGSYRLQPVYVEDMVDIIINAGHVTDNESYSYDILGPVISLSGYVRMLAARVAPQATFRSATS